jgi:hypothetical protein
VIEYGDNIGTLKNLFLDRHQAVIFAKKIIGLSYNQYESIGPNKWYCQEKKEYIKIEAD